MSVRNDVHTFMCDRDWLAGHSVVKGCRGSAGAIHRALAYLAAEGLVERRRDPEDRRRSQYRGAA